MKICDNASVGVLIERAGRWLVFDRATPPVGIAPVAGHVFDEHDGYADAAHAEVSEEIGLTVESLELLTGGWLPNRCRRAAGSRGYGHQWQVFQAQVSGELDPSTREVSNVRWLDCGELQQAADRAAAYAAGNVSEPQWRAQPGLEPVWAWWLTEIGLVHLDKVELERLADVAAADPTRPIRTETATGWISRTQQDRDHAGLRNVCAACGQPGTIGDPLSVADDGMRVHQSHTTDPDNGYHGRRQA